MSGMYYAGVRTGFGMYYTSDVQVMHTWCAGDV